MLSFSRIAGVGNVYKLGWATLYVGLFVYIGCVGYMFGKNVFASVLVSDGGQVKIMLRVWEGRWISKVWRVFASLRDLFYEARKLRDRLIREVAQKLAERARELVEKMADVISGIAGMFPSADTVVKLAVYSSVLADVVDVLRETSMCLKCARKLASNMAFVLVRKRAADRSMYDLEDEELIEAVREKLEQLISVVRENAGKVLALMRSRMVEDEEE